MLFILSILPDCVIGHGKRCEADDYWHRGPVYELCPGVARVCRHIQDKDGKTENSLEEKLKTTFDGWFYNLG